MRVSESTAGLVAAGAMVFCTGILIGLALHLRLGILGDIPEPTMSALGSLLGAALGAAASFLGAYALWQQQMHRSQVALAGAAYHCIQPVETGFALFYEDVRRVGVVQENAALMFSGGDIDLLYEHGQAMGLAIKDARRNLERIGQQLGSLNAEHVPWFLFAEQTMNAAQDFATAVENGSVFFSGMFGTLGNTSVRVVLLGEDAQARIEYFRRCVSMTAQQLQTSAPSQSAFGDLPRPPGV